jgi:prepilin-type processing-associated H-X9-DG protein
MRLGTPPSITAGTVSTNLSDSLNTDASQGWALEPMGHYGWWAPSGGAYGLSDVTLSALGSVNFRIPIPFGSAGAADQTTFQITLDPQRVGAYGSMHTGGTNVAFCDGSARFLSENIDLQVFRSLGTRSGGEVVGDY